MSNKIFFFVAIVFFCVHTLAADDLRSIAGKRKLVLPPANAGQQTGDLPEVLDNTAVARLARRGRIAAVATPDNSDRPDPSDERPTVSLSADSKAREKWRKRHRTEVNRIRAVKSKISKARTDLQGLEDRFFRASSEKERLRIEPRLNAQRVKLSELERQLRDAESSFSGMIREARAEGAVPGWFRDLPSP